MWYSEGGLHTVTLVSVPDPKTNLSTNHFQYHTQVILEAIYTLDVVWERDYYHTWIHLNGLVAAPIVHGHQASGMFSTPPPSPSLFSTPPLPPLPSAPSLSILSHYTTDLWVLILYYWSLQAFCTQPYIWGSWCEMSTEENATCFLW